MKINSFKAVNVHGYLNYDIKFFSELTFLIGINGSGKTSALKLILGLVSPSYQYLNLIEYDSAELVCSSTEDEMDIILSATQNRENGTFSLGITTSNFNEKPQAFPRFFRNEREVDSEEISIKERALREQFDTNEITRKIRELATPKFLGLDRRIYEGRKIDAHLRRAQLLTLQKYKRRPSSTIGGFNAIDNSLEDVQYLIYDYFRKIAQQQPKISEEFKRKIFELSFKYNDDTKLSSDVVNLEVLMDKKQKVLAAVKSLDLTFLDFSARTFYERIEKLITEKKEVEAKIGDDISNKSEDLENQMNLLIQWVNNSSQMKRIEEIIDYSQTYQEKIAELRSPIKRMEGILDNFLNESNKSIRISEDGEIKVQFSNGKQASVYELSSGEKQIVIMIAHLIFEEDQKPSGVFIIDEPELSLHIAWQEIFVNAITEASPKTQFILATHSPSIISEVSRERFCQDLNKLNTHL